MNPRVLLIGGIVLVLLIVGSVAVYFKVFKSESNPQAEAEAALKKNSDEDNFTDVEEQAAGTDIRDSKRFPGSHKKVLISRSAIAPNTLVEDKMIDVKEVPARGEAPDAAILENDRSKVVGHISQMDIREGAFMVENMVYVGRPQLSYLIPKYKRAISLTYEPLSAVSGLVNLGDVVDIIGHFFINRRVGGSLQYTKIFVQNARIVALGREFVPRSPTDTSTVAEPTGFTLSVYPHEAERLIWAQASGARMVCALRSPLNDVLARTSGTTDEGIFGNNLLREPRNVEVYMSADYGYRTGFDPVTDNALSLGAR